MRVRQVVAPGHLGGMMLMGGNVGGRGRELLGTVVRATSMYNPRSGNCSGISYRWGVPWSGMSLGGPARRNIIEYNGI